MDNHDKSYLIRQQKSKLIEIYIKLIDIKIDKLKHEINKSKISKLEDAIDVLIQRLELL